MKRLRAGVIGVLVGAASAFLSPAPSATAASGWAIEPTPALPGATQSSLNGVSCTSATVCVAVGSYLNTSSQSVTLAERWDGSEWSLQTTPNPRQGGALSGVSCASSTSCVAVGYTNPSGKEMKTLAEVWNGTAWTIEPTPVVPGQTSSFLTGVSCPSVSFCVAIGSMGVEQWDGSTWTIPSFPGGGAPTSVSCQTPSFCMTVGGMQAEEWNGTAWSIEAIPAPAKATGAVIEAVSCAALTTCAAAGGWSEVHCIPNPSCHCYPRSPVCPYTHKSGILVEAWNGSAWTIQSTKRGITVLRLLSCTTTACTAAGPDPTPGPVVVFHGFGSHWRVQAELYVAALSSVSCTSSAVCTAVGSSGGQTLAEAEH